MNFLAHAYLSFDEPDVLVGNFFADGVKGKNYLNYSLGVQQGILLHRFIDAYTDNHPINVEFRKWLRPMSGKFAGVVADILYDYTLSNSGLIPDLKLYTSSVYGVLDNHQHIFTGRLQLMYPYMRSGDWMFHSQYKEGTASACAGIGRRFGSDKDLGIAASWALDNDAFVIDCFQQFFPQLEKSAREKLEELKQNGSN